MLSYGIRKEISQQIRIFYIKPINQKQIEKYLMKNFMLHSTEEIQLI